ESLEGAFALLTGATGETRILAGGTDLLVQMRADVVDPDLIVDIKKIAETRAITEEKGGWRVGAAVTGAELKEHPRLKQVWPGVIEAANLIGSTQVQGRATLGGNLCNGSPAADSVPALIAAGAVATLAGAGGPRAPPGARGRLVAPCRGPGGCGRCRDGGAAATCRSRTLCSGPASSRSRRARSSPLSCCRRGRPAPATPISASSRAPQWTLRWSGREAA